MQPSQKNGEFCKHLADAVIQQSLQSASQWVTHIQTISILSTVQSVLLDYNYDCVSGTLISTTKQALLTETGWW